MPLSSRISGIDQMSLRPDGKMESRIHGSVDGLGSGVAGVDGGAAADVDGWPEVEPEEPEVWPEVVSDDVVSLVVVSVMAEHDADLQSACRPDPSWAAAAAGKAGLAGGGGT